MTKAGNVFQITFGGTLNGTGVDELTSDASTIDVDTVQEGRDPRFAMYIGSILLDPSDSNTIFVGTGDPTSSADSFYGTGLYVSHDAGATWSLVTDSAGFNPFDGKAISKVIVDPFRDDIYVASSDRVTPRNEVQHISFNFDGTFTLSFT